MFTYYSRSLIIEMEANLPRDYDDVNSLKRDSLHIKNERTPTQSYFWGYGFIKSLLEFKRDGMYNSANRGFKAKDETYSSVRSDDIDVEVDLDSSLKYKCKKCSDHSTFIPISQLDKGHLPEGYRDDDLIDTIRVQGQLTVKVKVTCTDDDVKLASGRVVNVVENKTTRHCPCSKCQGSTRPSRRWWNVVVLTSSHVVLDETEARNSTCRLFYDSDNAEVITVKGVGIMNSFAATEMRKLICATCDEGLADKLTSLLDKFTALHERTFDKFWNAKNKEKLVVIVSHPHGYSQRVSIGRSEKTLRLAGGLNSLTYTTDTCPGSTGAYLYVL